MITHEQLKSCQKYEYGQQADEDLQSCAQLQECDSLLTQPELLTAPIMARRCTGSS